MGEGMTERSNHSSRSLQDPGRGSADAPVTADGIPEADVIDRMVEAVVALYRHDHDLLTHDVNERSITHKLAEHMQPLFPRWHVDCEYNRCGYDPKRINLDFEQICPDDTIAKTVYPDIIVHRRGMRDNLLVIEFKKADGEGEEIDIQKLHGFLSEEIFGYRFGLFLRLGPQPVRRMDALLFSGMREPKQYIDCMKQFLSALKELGYGG